jgi:hypothetical protein
MKRFPSISISKSAKQNKNRIRTTKQVQRITYLKERKKLKAYPEDTSQIF